MTFDSFSPFHRADGSFAGRMRAHDSLLCPPEHLILLAAHRGMTPFATGMRMMIITPSLHDVPSEDVTDFTATPARQAARARLVRGTVLRDESGRVYEQVGDDMRELRRVTRGGDGQLYEVMTDQGAIATPPAQERETEQVKATQKPPSKAWRRVTREPGLRRLVRLGDLRAILAPQLAHPDRLRDEHRLPCHVDIFEAMEEQTLTSLRDAIGGAPVEPLTDAWVRALRLRGLEQRVRRTESRRRTPGVVVAGEMMARVRVVSDPTREREARDSSGPTLPESSLPRTQSTPSGTCGRSIPEQYHRPWELRRTREEAMREMAADAAPGASLIMRLRRLWERLTSRRDVRRWRGELVGRSMDDQLFAIRPPRSALWDTAVRGWVRETLELAGYSSRVTVRDWELYWRCKGL